MISFLCILYVINIYVTGDITLFVQEPLALFLLYSL